MATATFLHYAISTARYPSRSIISKHIRLL